MSTSVCGNEGYFAVFVVKIIILHLSNNITLNLRVI